AVAAGPREPAVACLVVRNTRKSAPAKRFHRRAPPAEERVRRPVLCGRRGRERREERDRDRADDRRRDRHRTSKTPIPHALTIDWTTDVPNPRTRTSGAPTRSTPGRRSSRRRRESLPTCPERGHPPT